MLMVMAIRMKEWGMLAPAQQQVDRSGQKRVILDQINVAQRRERSIQHLADGVGEFTHDEGLRREKRAQDEQDALMAEVESTGELSSFMNNLEEANRLVQEEMRDLPHDQDFEYAWKQKASPHFTAALNQLSPTARAAGEQIASHYSEQSFIATKQQRKLGRIAKARNSWNQSLQHSINRGDEAEAMSWIDSVVDIFVPRNSVAEAKQNAQSAARYRQWDEQFKASPFKALASYKNAKKDELPLNEDHKEELQQLYIDTQRGARSALVDHLSRQIIAGKPIKPTSLKQVEEAGILSQQQIQHLNYSPVRSNTKSELDYCQWQKRIDQTNDDEEDLINLKLELATAPLSQSAKKSLLLRFDQTGKLSPSKRKRMSSNIWQAYNRGDFGTRGGQHSLARLRQLQELAPSIVEEEGLDKLDALIEQYRLPEQVWVCLDDQILKTR